jgi:Rubisco Assembly chaperone C-terminal domain
MFAVGSLHGENACFMPLKQLDQDSYAPRIVHVAGAYPGLTKAEFYAVTSEPSPPAGQWSYDFSDPDGPQLGTVALEGSNLVAACEDPVVIIAEHVALGIELPKAITEPVDLIVLVDRAKNRFGERRFLVLDVPGSTDGRLTIAAYNAKSELPAGCEILGQVEQVQIPWLPSMAPTKTGFLEADEYY